MPDRSPQKLWETALGQLELQVTRPNFETWLRNTAGLSLEGDQLIVGVPSDFALEWLRSRMQSLISRTVSQLLSSPASVTFQVLGAQAAPTPLAANSGRPAPTAVPPPPELNPQFTFESFTVVKSNHLAYRAAQGLASGDTTYNPLVLCGAPGLGKTHLLHAIGHDATHAGKRVIALTGEAFVDGYVKAVRRGQPQSFRDPFHGCELLLLDDLGFLTTRSASQEQFFHIFNALHERGCHLVVTIDSAPAVLTSLTARLQSRLQGGLIIDLQPPTQADCLLILQAKATHLHQPLPEPVLLLIASQSFKNVRELEGALNRVTAYMDLAGGSLTVEAARQALFPLRPVQQQPSAQAIIQAVADHFHLSLEQLSGSSRARDVTYARHIAMYLLRRHASQPLASIGRLLGGRDHSTILNGCRRIQQELTSLPQTLAAVEELEASLLNQPAA